MRQQAAQKHAGTGQEQGALGQAAIVGLVMFEAEVRHMIAESEQKMIVAIMARAKKLARFGNQIDHLLLVLDAHVQRGFAVGDHVEFVMDGLARGRDVDGAIIFAGNYRRVHEHIERNRLERNLLAGMLFNRKRGAEFPAVGHEDFGFISQLLCRDAGRIEDHFIPFEDQQLVSCRNAIRFNVVVFGFETADAGGDFQMEGVHIQQIALPRNGLAVRLEFEAGEACDGPIGSVLAGNPFGIVKRQRPRFDGNDFVSAQELLLSPGCVYRDRDRLAGQRGGCGDDQGYGEKHQGAKTAQFHANAPCAKQKKSTCASYYQAAGGGSVQLGRMLGWERFE